MKLKDLQDNLQNAILTANGSTVMDLISDSQKESKDVLFSVYSNAYVLRLIEFLTNDYEKLHEYLGDEQFNQLAHTYIANNPSRHPNGRWFGSKLPWFIANIEPYSKHPLLADIASFENALSDVFDATDKPLLTLEDLGTLAPEDWPKLQLIPHPAVVRLNMTSNALDIWIALNEEEDVPDADELEEKQQIVVYRDNRKSSFRVMDYPEAMMWDQAAKGVPFGILCEMMGTYAPEDEAPALAAGYLQTWIATGMLTDYKF